MSEIHSYRLIELPGVADIERTRTTRGALWLPENDNLQERVDQVSVGLFGVTEEDTDLPEPELWAFLSAEDKAHVDRGLGPIFDVDRAHKDLSTAYDEWVLWEDNFSILCEDSGISDEEITAFFSVLGFDVLNHAGEQLECLHDFSRQMVVVARGLMPEASFTPDGSGKRGGQSLEQWEASLAADAAAFGNRKRK